MFATHNSDTFVDFRLFWGEDQRIRTLIVSNPNRYDRKWKINSGFLLTQILMSILLLFLDILGNEILITPHPLISLIHLITCMLSLSIYLSWCLNSLIHFFTLRRYSRC